MTYLVSVVIPTYHRLALLERCLAALLEQDFDPAAYEILVVDDAHCDVTRDRMAQLAWQACRRGHTLRYLRPAMGSGPAAARNIGWRAARGEVIAFTDDDCIPASNWLRYGLAALGQDVAGASGKIIVPLDDAVPTDYERNAALLEMSEFATANCFYRRDALEEAGGFDERFTLAWREDTDLFLTLLERGARLVRAEDAAVIHPVRPAAWGVSVRQQRKSQFNALLYKKHPTLYRERVQARPPWRYYAIVGMLLLTLLALCAGAWLAAVATAGTWAMLTVRFCALRLRHTSRAPAHVAEMIVTSAVIPPLAIFWRLRGAIACRVWFL